MIEMGEYFHTVLKPRIQKVVFSENWKDGVPVPDAKANPKNPYNGVSHCFKYFNLESYEDTLNNLTLKRSDEQLELLGSSDTDPSLKEDYLLNYMLDVESDGSLLNVDAFQKPFEYRLKIATGSAGATEWRKIDLVETFNYLVGLTVDKYEAHRIDEGMLLVEGRLPDGARALVVWRDCEAYPYEKLTEFLQKKGVNPREMEFDVIYINGDHTLPNLQVGSEGDGEPVFKFKVRSTEQAFLEAMFQVEDV